MFDVSYSYGWNRYQTAGPNFARARLGVFQRGFEGVWKPGGWHGVFAEGGKDRLVGSAIYNSKSQIVARRFSRRRQDLDLDFFRRRIAQASEYRNRRNLDPKLRRVVWSESDGLPGVIVDRYGDHFVFQNFTLAMDMRKDLIVEAIHALEAHATIVERNDAAIRKAEGLE